MMPVIRVDRVQARADHLDNFMVERSEHARERAGYRLVILGNQYPHATLERKLHTNCRTFVRLGRRPDYRPIRIRIPAIKARSPSRIMGVMIANAVVIPYTIRKIASTSMPMFLLKFIAAGLAVGSWFVTRKRLLLYRNRPAANLAQLCVN